MDPLSHARDVPEQILREPKILEAQSPDSVQSHDIEAAQNGDYLIIHTGYSAEEGHRIYGVVFHGWFRDCKIWVERGVAATLFTEELYRLPMPA